MRDNNKTHQKRKRKLEIKLQHRNGIEENLQKSINMSTRSR